MTPFAAYTAAETRNIFQWLDNPKNCPIPWGISTSSLGPPEATFQSASRLGSAVFAGFTNVTNGHTDTQTDRNAPSAAIGRIYAIPPDDGIQSLLEALSKETSPTNTGAF